MVAGSAPRRQRRTGHARPKAAGSRAGTKRPAGQGACRGSTSGTFSDRTPVGPVFRRQAQISGIHGGGAAYRAFEQSCHNPSGKLKYSQNLREVRARRRTQRRRGRGDGVLRLDQAILDPIIGSLLPAGQDPIVPDVQDLRRAIKRIAGEHHRVGFIASSGCYQSEVGGLWNR